MFNPKALILSLGLLATLFLAACQGAASSFECPDPVGCVTIGPDEPIKIGSLNVIRGEIVVQPNSGWSV
jgi:hypothetical protein